ncbi:Ig-like domain-containing protein, partial [Acinetobacter baumannii]|uniref:Ig-like domain-containing protein n=1 Tax=Acinetobacter baumannii TaxID=470 RepID=UPI003EDB6901
NLGTGDVLDGTDGFVVDIIPPTLAITTDDLALATGETANITFTFSEAVTGFDVSDIAVVGGTEDSVTFKNYLSDSDSYSRDFNFIFADKTASTTELTSLTIQLNGTDGNDVLNGWKGK